MYSAEGTKHGKLNIIYLYGEKKNLKDFLTGELSSVYESKIVDRLEYRFKNLQEKYFVPDHTYSVKSRLEWLAGYLDGDGCIYRNGKTQQITASSTNKEFLEKIYYMLQTLGINSKIKMFREEGERLLPKNDGSNELGLYKTNNCYRLLVPAIESQKLLELGLKLNRLIINKEEVNREATRFIQVLEINDISGEHDTFCCTEPLRNKVIFNGVMTGNCSEIMLPTSVEESFVCCLSSMNLLHYDEWKDTDAPEVLTYFLDVVISEFLRKTKDEPFMKKARRFAERHRALGVGVLGWHSYLQSNSIPFDSFEATMKNREIFKLLKEKTYKASEELAKLFGEPELLKGYGRRNTTLMAIAPTKSSSFILGEVSQGIEPFKSNYTIKDMAKIKKTWKNPYLVKVLQEKGMDNEEVWESIMIRDGSVQHLNFLTEHEKDVFKTFSEISQLGIIQQAAQRQKYIDQGQSLNIMIHPKTEPKDINKLYLTAAKLGIKSIYYQYSVNAAQAFNRSLLECSSCEA